MGIAAGCLLAGRILLHYFQLESYQFPGYFRTVKRNLLKSILPGVCMTVLLIVSVIILTSLFSGMNARLILITAETVIMIAGGFAIGKTFSEKKAKKPFVITSRVKRLYAVSFLLITGFAVALRQNALVYVIAVLIILFLEALLSSASISARACAFLNGTTRRSPSVKTSGMPKKRT